MKSTERIIWIFSEVVCVAAILVAVYRIVMPLSEIYDVAIYDETVLYLKPALNFEWSEFSFYRSPAYVLWYVVLEFLSGLDPLGLYYVNHVVLLGGLATSIYVSLRSFVVRRCIALPLSVYAALWTMHLKALPRSVYFLLIVFLLYAALMRRLVRSETGRVAALIPLILFLSYVRAEFVAALLLPALYLAWRLLSSRGDVFGGRRFSAFLLPGLMLTLGLALFVGYGSPGGDQSRVDILELTVMQHYVRAYGERFDVPVPVDLAALPAWYARSFGPGEPGVWHMLISNPGEFLRHVGFNVSLLFENFWREFQQHWPVFAQSDAAGMARESRWIGYVFVVVLVAVVIGLRRKILARNFLEQVFVLMVLITPFTAACLVFYPREHYLLPLLCAALLLSSLLLELGVREFPWRLTPSVPIAFQGVVTLLGCALMLLLMPRAVTVVENILAGPLHRPNLTTIHFLNELAAERDGLRVATADEGMLEYVPKVRKVTLERDADVSLEDRLRESDAFLFDYPELLPAYFPESELRRRLQAATADPPPGWVRRNIEAAPFRVLWHRVDL